MRTNALAQAPLGLPRRACCGRNTTRRQFHVREDCLPMFRRLQSAPPWPHPALSCSPTFGHHTSRRTYPRLAQSASRTLGRTYIPLPCPVVATRSISVVRSVVRLTANALSERLFPRQLPPEAPPVYVGSGSAYTGYLQPAGPARIFVFVFTTLRFVFSCLSRRERKGKKKLVR